MQKNIIDANLILRFLLNDNQQKASRIEKLLRSKNHVNILLDTVVAEIVWVLTSYYELSKENVAQKVRALIHVESIECNTHLLDRTLSIWEQNAVSFIDAYIASIAQLGNMTLYTYDKKLSQLPFIAIREP